MEKSDFKKYIHMHGIYIIINKVNGMIYVGSSIDLNQRCRQHYLELSKNKHHNKKIQNSWNKYGSDSFEIKILALLETKDVLIRTEQIFIDFYKSYDPKIGFNICPYAETTTGVKHSVETITKRTKSQREARRKTGDPILCYENKKIYYCTFDIAEELKVDQQQVNYCLNPNYRRQKVGGYSFCYLKNIDKAVYRPPAANIKPPWSESTRKMYMNTYYKKMSPIYCNNTRKIYRGAKELAEEIGCYPTNIYKILKNGRGKKNCTYDINIIYCKDLDYQI